MHLIVRPLQSEGAGNAGCPMHPQPCVRYGVVSMHTGIHSGGTGNIRHSPRDGFTAYNGLSPGTNCCFDPVIRATRWRVANLTPAKGRQNHPASPSATDALVSRPAAATASRLTFVTIAKRPSCGSGTEGVNHVFPKNGSEMFLRRGLDGERRLRALRKLR